MTNDSSVVAVRNGPGFLVQWAPSAAFYRIFVAREPSPSFYEITSPLCCPLLPNGTRPCCPFYAPSLQVEAGLTPGAWYRFRVTNGDDHSVVGVSQPVQAAAVPAAPGLPVLQPTIFHSGSSPGAVFDAHFAPPVSDGGDVVRGYRINANITSLNISSITLVDNTSSGRPMSEWNREAHPRHSRPLPLLPGHTYQIGVQALNAVGAGPLSPVLTIETPVGPIAEFELPVNAWRRGRIERGGVVRHRVFLPVATSWARIVLQQTLGHSCCTSLAERQTKLELRSLHLRVRAGDLPSLPLSPPDHFSSATVLTRSRIDDLSLHGLENTSATNGELSIAIDYPSSRWLHVMVHAAAVEDAVEDYDIRVDAEASTIRDTQTDVAGRVRYDALSARWRYLADSAAHGDWVVKRHVHPLS